ncbi:MAG TPA: fumarylacetoacetate hydrolase family protein [Gammaproteobacteria bacterium]|nr:fumarylacetoacetate hydrolase family protein [Gammaproteobacteria bacterium]
MKVFVTPTGIFLESNGRYFRPDAPLDLDTIFTAPNPAELVGRFLNGAGLTDPPPESELLAPISRQEVWAAGVTYMRSKAARMEEAKDTGGGDFYDRVYDAERPELFFKATPQRVVGPGAEVRIRSDSNWNVPEPELTLAISAGGRIFGYSIGNDMSSRDIEGQNPLYLAQAKIYAGSAALGPCLVVSDELPGPSTQIRIDIVRAGQSVFDGSTNIGQMKRSLQSLAEFLYRDNSFPFGAYLMTGTGIVPPDSFSLEHGDEIRITIDAVGTLSNAVA